MKNCPKMDDIFSDSKYVHSVEDQSSWTKQSCLHLFVKSSRVQNYMCHPFYMVWKRYDVI